MAINVSQSSSEGAQLHPMICHTPDILQPSWLRRSSIQHVGQKVHVRLLHAVCPLATHNHSRAVIAKRSYILHSSFKATITGKEIPYNLDNNRAYQHPQNTPNEALGMTNDEPQLSSEEVQVYPAICNNNVSVLLLHRARLWQIADSAAGPYPQD
ncbi:hypothetical protein M422DRAFT_36357 [Sphaerobolus stellatus SS14]|uniref:Uncharacterized protein n=1 Tax=Sphaerobolus stellatus (strain SS14) TaxID=990650 RepID=A0A0C9U975_SPHS4|nr:hypothetical protein M422DRAFT_36357 [Sphaerobolus stellatus SS14]